MEEEFDSKGCDFSRNKMFKDTKVTCFSVFEHFINKKVGCDGNPLILGDLNTL